MSSRNPLALHYSSFRVSRRLLLTGHSHQAWPDAGFAGQLRAWLDAAELVDGKWERAEEQAQRVREGFAGLVGDVPGNIALGQNTHELVTRWLSALPLQERPRLVTTSAEFHTVRRQFDRLAECGIDVVRVTASPVESLAERLAAEINDRTAGVVVSSVRFDTAEIVPNLGAVAAACERHGALLLVDAYHHLNVVPFELAASGLERAFVTGGGYKYCQLGEGNCFLRVPDGLRLRPVLTGWFAEFGALERDAGGSVVPYPPGAGAFVGATYDPTSHYRAAAVFEFHRQQALTPERLRAVSRTQVDLLRRAFLELDVDPRVARVTEMPEERRAGFLAVRADAASDVAAALRTRGVFADARASILRLGPAPYLHDDQLRDAVAILGEILRAMPAPRPA